MKIINEVENSSTFPHTTKKIKKISCLIKSGNIFREQINKTNQIYSKYPINVIINQQIIEIN